MQRLAPFVLAAALAVGLSATALAAPRDDVTIGMTIEPTGMDPTAAAPVAIGQVVWQNLFQGLTRIDEKGAVEPQLAKSWEISADGLQYTFHLQDNVQFHNGAAFNAQTAKFSLDRARGDQSTNPQKQFFAAIEAVETPDDNTLLVRLSEPAGNLLYWLAWPASVMVEPGSADANRTNPIGTGPFSFGEWRQGDRATLERFDGYWGTHPALAKATFRFINDPQAQLAALKSGQVDAFPEFAAPELFYELETDPNFETSVGNTELKVVAGMNNRNPPFNDVRVRQALMLAVNRGELITGAWSGYGQAIGSHYTPNDPGYISLEDVLSHDQEKARALLAEAGYPEGFNATIKTPQMAYARRSAEILQAFLADVGVQLTIVPTEFPAVWVSEVLQGHDFDMTIVAHAEPMDIGIYARPDYYFGYENADFAGIINKAETTTDEATRLELYGQAQRKLANDVPALYLFVMPKLGVWKNGLQGLWDNEPIPSNDLTAVQWSD
ncbi:ABC transporter substrate-binding protein [Aureimonas fodinaquatilis]|uniref:ABC transporter substrate-binding protein n=1 Tax=Aureimonas fodinaquatilis TaxID=2565783 RepID=A0A5B0DYR8_9HYPH|nr:ABC transporter substrate-binding protein [Aureimonas fodinaquatilis]KAA0970911.1 ABC transporter substrate-binding protein [Aureimonas fodinaquatilis]